MVYVSLHYDGIHSLGGFNFGDASIDEITSSLKDFKQRVETLEQTLEQFIVARESVIANLSVPSNDRAECDVYITTNFSEYATKTLRATISHASPVVVEEAMNQYMSHAGTPNMVGNGSDYALANRVLAGYGKELKTRFWDKGNGAHVVDKKQPTPNRVVSFLNSLRT